MGKLFKRNIFVLILGAILFSGLAYGIAGVDFDGWHHKHGVAPTGVQTTASDIWPLSNSDADQIVYVAPTEARLVEVWSDNVNDTGGGTGARVLRIFGLTAWNAVETTTDIALDGNTTVTTTTAAFVFINRAKVISCGGTSINAGTININAQIDDTVSGIIRPGIGQTQQAIMAIPSTQTYLMRAWHGTINKQTGQTGTVLFSLRVNESPEEQLTCFTSKDDRGLQANGTSSDDWPFEPGFAIPGPAIIKISGIASTNDIEAAGGWSGEIQNN